MKENGIVIIGNGVAGVTTARHIRKRSKQPICIISSETKHFFSRTALMYIYMGHMKYEHTKPFEDSFWEKNKIDLIQDRVDRIDPSSSSILLAEGGEMKYDQLVIATGSKTATFGWEGLDLKGVQGLYSFQDLQSMEENSRDLKRAVIIGGGLIGVEMAEMFHSRGIAVTFLVREKRFWGSVLPKEEGEVVGHHIREEGIDLRFEMELDKIIGDENGRVRSIICKNGEEIDCQFVGITTGVRPNISFLENSGIETDRGVLVNDQLQTNYNNIYAVGDCAQMRTPTEGRRAIEAVWYVGKMMGEVAAANICGQTTDYRPGKWFNSAKFFHLEYQTYGIVPANLPDGQEGVYWEAKDRSACLKLVYESSSRRFLGINTFGIRLDHRTFDYWLNAEASIDEVVNALEQADFNPEFYNTPYQEIKSKLLSQLNATVNG